MNPPPKRKLANRNCCVFGCHSRDSKKLGLSFHIFPKKGERKVFLMNKFGDNELVDKRFVWLKQIRAKTVTDHMRICSLHFKKDDYILPGVLCKAKRLKRNAIPTCNLPKQVIVVPRQTKRSRGIKVEQPDITEATYGGRNSGKVISEQSKLIEECEPSKETIIDKFRIDKIAGSYGIKLIRPQFLRKQNQLTKKKQNLIAK